MIIQTIEQQLEKNKRISLLALILSFLIALISLLSAFLLVQDSRKSIYVLDHGTPILLNRSDALVNRDVEYRSQVELFHRLFFTLAPDEKYIEENLSKSLYLIDDSARKEYSNLKEKGFYNQLISSSSMVSLQVDSIRVDKEKKHFEFFGTQRIHRRSATIVRRLWTEGYYKDMVRSPQNPHGVLLLDWRIVDNTELSNQPKYEF